MTTPSSGASDPADQAMHEQRDERARQLLDHLGRPVRRALDLGCGRGETLSALALRGVGIDLGILRLRLAPGPVAQADGARLPFPAASFDVVLAMEVFSSIPAEAHRRVMAAEIVRTLTPDGVVLWYDQRWPSPANRATRPVSRHDLAGLFPGADRELETITLAPALARALPRQYQRLHHLGPLRSHLIGLIRPTG
ncbi:MAG: class I SAM-dependent methyltransferase [Acidimicrobiales bacterium]